MRSSSFSSPKLLANICIHQSFRRFPCVDGVRFTFDPTKPPGNRVVLGSVVVREKPLVPKRHTIIRGTKINMQYDDEVETDAEKREVEIGDFSETPTGYCPLDLCRFYDVASIEYLLKGKVMQYSQLSC